jgi:hypothetical protein
MMIKKMLALLAFAAIPLLGATPRIERTEISPATRSKVMKMFQHQQERIRSNAVSVENASPIITFLAAGSIPGQNGTFFKSDVMLMNFGPEQRALILWLERGVDGSSSPVYEITLPAGDTGTFTDTNLFFPDFVTNELEEEGLGSVVIIAIDANDEIDSSARLTGMSRIWTNQPNATGTVSQPFPSVDPLYFGTEAYIVGLRHDESYRTNVGIMNLDLEPHTFTLTIVGERKRETMQVTVKAASMEQVPFPAGDYGNAHVYVKTDSGEVNYTWGTYGTSTDNITGDGWVSLGTIPDSFF